MTVHLNLLRSAYMHVLLSFFRRLKYGCLISLIILFSACSDKTEPQLPPSATPQPRAVQPSFPRTASPAATLPLRKVTGISHRKGSSAHPYIALTFDDGPHPVHTPKLLRILRAKNVRATFYVTGKNASRYPHLIRQMVAQGHEIGNHTWSHPNLTKLSDAQVRNEINRSNAAIARAAGVRPRTFRPPYGALTTRQRAWINAEYAYPIVFWSVDPRDWKNRNASVVRSRIVNGTTRGSIILLHDIHASSVQAVPSTMDTLLSRGYKFVTVSELLSQR